MENLALTESTYYILLSLYHPQHGYGIMQQTEQLSGGRVHLAAGTLYGALNSLCEKGWIRQLPVERGSRKKEYQLTAEGLAVLKHELARLQQLVANSYLNKGDMDELIRKNVEKANKKRAKKGLPPQKVNQNATASLKHMQAVQEREEAERAEKLEKSKKQVEASNSYYNKDAKPGSLASKANMVARYNEKHNNK